MQCIELITILGYKNKQTAKCAENSTLQNAKTFPGPKIMIALRLVMNSLFAVSGQPKFHKYEMAAKNNFKQIRKFFIIFNTESLKLWTN